MAVPRRSVGPTPLQRRAQVQAEGVNRRLKGASFRRSKVRKPTSQHVLPSRHAACSPHHSRPINFLENVVLKEEGVKDWVRKQLLIQSKGRLQRGRSAWYAPRLWVCTGVQLISDGGVRFHTSSSTSFGAGVELDPGLLATGIPTGQSIAELHGGVAFSKSTENAYHHDDERVWAAQWYQVEVKFGARGADEDEKPMSFRLKPAEDLKHGVRKFAEPGDGNGGSTADGDEPVDVAEIVGLADPEGVPVASQSPTLATSHAQAATQAVTVVFDETPYAAAMKGIDWKMYRDYDSYLDGMDE